MTSANWRHTRRFTVPGSRERSPGLIGNLRANSTGVAIRAVDLRQVSDVDRVLELRQVCGGDAGCTFRFRQHRVALITVAANDAAVGADVLAIMTAETSRRVEVAEIVGMRLPVQLHLG